MKEQAVYESGKGYLVVGYVFGVPVALQPVFRSVLFDKVADAVAEVIRFKEEKLDDEVANLSFVALVTSHRLGNSNH